MRLVYSRADATSSGAQRSHQFVIVRNAPNDPFAGRGAIYTCIRCNWSFAMRGRSIVALDEAGVPMGGEEARARMASFEAGPCPVSAVGKLTLMARPTRAAEPLRERRAFSG